MESFRAPLFIIMSYRIILSIILTLVLIPLYGQTYHTVSGIVFNDINGNGLQDHNEKGIKNVLISNGEEIVVSARDGKYTISAQEGASVFVILPAKYGFNSKIMNAPSLYIDSERELPATIVHHFALQRRSVPKEFSVAAVGDIQVGNHQEISYANQTIMSELSGRSDIDFSIFLGDQINDNLSLQSEMRSILSTLPYPSWLLLGNHDRNSNNDRFQDDEFSRNFGASHYAFNYGKVHFIVLNNIFSEGGRKYYGKIPEKQLRFVENSLQYVPRKQLVVICMHIPLAATSNHAQLVDILRDRPSVLVLSGHTHTVQRNFLSPNIHELTAGAACGNWWVGERDSRGIPHALMQCGSPRNYFTINFKSDHSYKLNFKGIGLDKNHQMDIWVGAQDSIDQHVNALAALGEKLIVATIYGASDSTQVTISLDGRELHTQKARMTAPAVERVIAMQKALVYPTRFSKRAALRGRASPHVWTAKIPEGETPGVYLIHIKAFDKYGFREEGSRLISIIPQIPE